RQREHTWLRVADGHHRSYEIRNHTMDTRTLLSAEGQGPVVACKRVLQGKNPREVSRQESTNHCIQTNAQTRDSRIPMSRSPRLPCILETRPGLRSKAPG